MMTTVETRSYTPDDLLRMEDGSHYELVDGCLLERNVSTDSGEVILWIGHEFVAFLKAQAVGRVYDSEVGVRAFPRNPTMVRRADIALVRAERIPVQPTDYLNVMPDLVVEVVSLGDRAHDVRAKVDVWLDAGVRVVWVVLPGVREVTVYQPGARPLVLGAEDVIDGGEVMPGFSCPVARFFPPAGAGRPPAQS